MCIAVYVAAHSPLPLIAFDERTPAFNVSALADQEQIVSRHLNFPWVRHAGSHTGCGCGFNEGREYPPVDADPIAERSDSLESSGQLVQYVRNHRVEAIYSCWSGDEEEPQEFGRRISPADLLAEDFYFREKELLVIEHEAGGSGS